MDRKISKPNNTLIFYKKNSGNKEVAVPPVLPASPQKTAQLPPSWAKQGLRAAATKPRVTQLQQQVKQPQAATALSKQRSVEVGFIFEPTLSPPVPFARWAHMRHFLSVRLYGLDQKSDWIIIHISESITGRTLKLHHMIKPWSLQLNHLHGLLQFLI